MNIQLPVRICGVDSNGSQFDDPACTLDVSATGARICGIQRSLATGSIITVHRGTYHANYRVLWSSDEQGQEPGQIGAELIDRGNFIWGLVLRRQLAEIDGQPEAMVPPASQRPLGGHGHRAR